MGLLAALALITAVYLLQASGHDDAVNRQPPIVLRNTCLPDEDLAEVAEDGIDNILSGIASSLVSGTGRK